MNHKIWALLGVLAYGYWGWRFLLAAAGGEPVGVLGLFLAAAMSIVYCTKELIELLED